MKCPVCDINLAHVRYEGLGVRHCEQCFGYLLAKSKADGIQRRRALSESDLSEQREAETQADRARRIKCPICRAWMAKQELFAGDLQIDRCDDCALIWFDGGELAAWQLGYERSERGVELAQMQDRLRGLPVERRAELEANLRKLPAGSSWWADGLSSALFSGTRRRWEH